MTPFHVIIPARYAAQRLPGKLLLPLHGRAILQHTYDRACQSQAQSVIIATDDPRIQSAAKSWGAAVVMTDPAHVSGTHRLIEVVAQQAASSDTIWINVQGDEPLIAPRNIDQLAYALAARPDIPFATLCEPIQSQAEYLDPHVVKVVRNCEEEALYFSRAPIPYSADPNAWQYAYRHVGLYAYRTQLLADWKHWTVNPLEQAEQLEQLRLLWQGKRCLVPVAQAHSPKGIDTPADYARLQGLVVSC